MNILEDMVGEWIVEQLTTSNQTNLTDPVYQAVLIKQGLFQDDPVGKRIVITVNPGNIDDTSADPRWKNVTAEADREIIQVPAYELGGGGFQWLRYTVDVSIYLVRTQEDQGKARNIGLTHFGIIYKTLDNKPIGLIDDLGYTALLSTVKGSAPYETGGPGSYIWKGKVFVEVLVAKS